jgi:hypothetical protein
VCHNCLGSDHAYNECKSGVCKHCQKNHHSLLHFEKRSNDSPKSSSTGPQPEVKASTSAHASAATTLMKTNHQILLSTAVVLVSNADGCPTVCRALLDSGSQNNFMTESLTQTIKLSKKQVNMPVYGISENVTTIKHKVVATIKSRISDYSAELEFLVIPKITGNLPITPITTSNWKIPTTLQLADPHFSSPHHRSIYSSWSHGSSTGFTTIIINY